MVAQSLLLVLVAAAVLLLLLDGVVGAPADWATVNGFLAGVVISDAGSLAAFSPDADVALAALSLPGAGVTVGSAVTGGGAVSVFVSDVSCAGIELSGALSLSSVPDGSDVRASVSVADVDFACTGTVNWSDLTAFTVAADAGAADFSLVSSGAGTAFSSDLVFTFGPGRRPGVDVDRPVAVSVDAATCAVSAAPTVLATLTTNVPADADVAELLAVLAEALVARTLTCAALGDVATDASVLLAALNADVDAVVQETPGDVAAAEAGMVARLSSEELASIVAFDESSISRLVVTFLNQVLGKPSNATGADPADLTINSVVRRLSDSEDGEVTVDLGVSASFDGTLFEDGLLTIDPNLTVAGLDSFLVFDSLQVEPLLKYSLTSDVQVEDFAVVAQLTAALADGGGAVYGGGRISSANALALTATTTLALPNVTASVTQAVAVNPDEIADVQYGAVEAAPLECGAPALYTQNVSAVEVEPLVLPAVLTLSALEDAALEAAAGDINGLLALLFQPSLTESLPNITRGLTPLMTEVLNDVAAEKAAEPCPAFTSDAAQGELLDFNSDGFDSLRETFDRTIVEVDDPNVGINQVVREIGVFNGDPAGTLSVATDIVFDMSANELDTLLVRITTVTFGNVDSFEFISLLEPTSAAGTTVETASAARLGVDAPLLVTLDVTVSGTGAFDRETQVLELAFTLDEVNASATADLNFLRAEAEALTLGQLTSVSCVLSALDFDGPESGITLSALDVDLAALAFQCGNCEIPTSEEQEIADSIFESIDSSLSFFVNGARAGDGKVAVNNGLIDVANECYNITEPPAPPRDEAVATLTLGAVNAAAYAGVAVALAAVCAGARRRSKRASASGGKPSGKPTGPQPRVLPAHRSLMMDRRTPASCKMLSALLFVVCVLLYASSNLSASATVVLTNVFLEDGTQVVVDDVFELTLSGTIADLFSFDLGLLGVVVALASGCWPYVRVLGTLLCMLMPPNMLHPQTRGSTLRMLDFFGKWAVVDQFLIVILVVVLDVTVPLRSSATSFSFLGGDIDINVALVPSWGVYGFFMGASLSLLFSHVVSHAHRKVTSPTSVTAVHRGLSRSAVRAMQHKERLSKHVFRPVLPRGNGRGEQRMRMRLGTAARFYASAGPAVCLALLGASLFADAVTFTYLGAGGKAIAAAEAGAEAVSFSVVDIMATLQSQGDTALQVVGIAFIQFFFFFTVLVAPLAQQVLLLVGFWAPLSLKEQRYVWVSLEMLAAWSALEVFVVALVAAVANVGPFVSLAVRKLCVDIDEFIDDWVVPFGLLDEEEGTCFTVSGQLEVAFVLVAVAALLNLTLVHTLGSFSRLCIEEREEMLLRLMQTEDPAQAAQAAANVYNQPLNLGCFHHLVKRRLRMLHSIGVVQVRPIGAGSTAPAKNRDSPGNLFDDSEGSGDDFDAHPDHNAKIMDIEVLEGQAAAVPLHAPPGLEPSSPAPPGGLSFGPPRPSL